MGKRDGPVLSVDGGETNALLRLNAGLVDVGLV